MNEVEFDQHFTHFDVSMVAAGDTVIGTLPVHLAAAICKKNASYLHLSMMVPAHLRGQELSASQMSTCKVTLQAFVVKGLYSK